MITRRILGTIFGAAIFCTLAGGILGWAIGCFWPEYYQIVFGRAAQQAAFDPVAVGVGLGVTQGAVAGLVVGCAAALLVAWVTIRRTPGPRSTPEGDVTTAAATKSPRHRGVAGCLLLSCAAVLVFAVGLAAGLLVGAVMAERAAYARVRGDRIEMIEPVLTRLNLENTRIYEGSGLWVDIAGTVPTTADRDMLHADLVWVLGERQAEDLMESVYVEDRPTEE